MSFRSGLRRGVSRDHPRQRGDSKEERLPEENWCVWEHIIHSLKDKKMHVWNAEATPMLNV